MTADIAEEYRSFSSSHRCQYLDIDEKRWEYIASGTGARSLLLLPGALGIAETSFQYVLAFEPTYRVLSLSFPGTSSTVASLVEGVVQILNAEKIPSTSVIGGSYGGLIAQSLVREYPERIDRLILSGVGAPRPERVHRWQFLTPVGSIRTWQGVKAVMRLTNRLSLAQNSQEHAFWRNYFDRIIDSLTPEDWMGKLSVVMDFDLHYSLAPLDPVEWADRILLVAGNQDFLFGAEDRAMVQSLYPGARFHSLHGSGHSGTLDRAGEYIALYKDFLNGSPEITSSSINRPL